ncbi:MAG: hypothetical protein ACI9MC_001931, partial [Kiritimatiellia bacterium]
RCTAILRHACQHDVDGDVRTAAAAMLQSPWQTRDAHNTLSRLLIPAASDNLSDLLQQLIHAQPELARLASVHLLTTRADRASCRHAARFIAQQTQPDHMHHVVSATIPQLRHADPAVREDSAIVLGNLPHEHWSPELLAEVVELLREIMAQEADATVQHAIVAALAQLNTDGDIT